MTIDWLLLAYMICERINNFMHPKDDKIIPDDAFIKLIIH